MITYTVQQIKAIKEEAFVAAEKAANELEKELNNKNFYGSCGYAWLSILNIKGSSRLGKNMKEAGIPRAHDKSLQIWNPSRTASQSIDVKEAGAKAAAQVWKNYNFLTYVQTRLD